MDCVAIYMVMENPTINEIRGDRLRSAQSGIEILIYIIFEKES